MITKHTGTAVYSLPSPRLKGEVHSEKKEFIVFSESA